jgi:PAS domain S-box-containing protein
MPLHPKPPTEKSISRSEPDTHIIDPIPHFFQQVVPNISDLIAILDLDGKRIYSSPSYKDTLGDPATLIGTDSFAEIHPSDREKVREVFQETIKNGHGQPLEYRFVRADGSIRYIESQGGVVRGSGGNVTHVIVVSRDITERKRTEKIQSAVYKISESANSAASLQQLYHSIHNTIAELMPAKNFYIALVDTASAMISFPYFTDEYDPPPSPKKLGKGLTEYVLRTGKPILASPEVFGQLVHNGEVESIGAPSIDWLGVPLRTKERTIGVLVVQSYTEGVRYTEEEKNILIFVSEQIAMAIERKYVEEEVSDWKKRYELVVASSDQIVYDYNLATGEILWSGSITQVLGYDRSDMLGGIKQWSSLIHPEDSDTANAILEEKERTRQLYDVEYRFRHKDGHYLWFHDRGLFHQDGSNVRMLGMMRDITAQKLAQNELLRLNRAMKTISECNEVLVRASDEQILLHQICRLIVDTGGYRMAWVGTADYDKEKNVRPVAHAGFEDGYLSQVKISWEDNDFGKGPTGTAIRTGQPFPIQNIMKEKLFAPWRDAAVKRGYVSVLGLPLRFESQTFGALTIYSADADSFDKEEVRLLLELANDLAYGMASFRTRNEHTNALDKLKEQAALLDIATDAIVVIDLEGNIVYWNKGAEHLYQWTSAESVGKSFIELLHSDSIKEVLTATDVTLTDGFWSGELEQVTKNGTKCTVESRWTIVRQENGDPKSIFISNTDITAKKRLELQYLRIQRMEGIGTLAGGIAHDLNNVLAPILLSLEIFKKRFSDSQSQQMLSIVESSARRGAEMVKQVLTFARGIDGERITVQPSHLIKEMEKIMRETFPRDISIKSDIPKNLWIITGDPTQLHQVLLNLCVNARDAMPNGGALTVGASNIVLDENFARMQPESHPGRYVILKVSDNGTGIPQSIIAKIFEPFFTTKELGKGTGFGLSTVHSIVRSHGGFVNVYSEIGKGTSFRVYLPAQEDASANEQEEEQKEIPNGNGETILVIDDEISIREVTRDTLESRGYKVLTANDGTEALTLCTQHLNEISLCLTDIMMPYMDGPSTIRALHKIKPALKIIAASGLATHSVLENDEQGYVDAFLQKPFTAEKLLLLIHEVLTGTHKQPLKKS